MLIIVAYAAFADLIGDFGIGVHHAEPREDISVERFGKGHVGLLFDDILHDHGVDVGIQADSGRGHGCRHEQALKPFFAIWSIVNPSCGLQACLKAHGVKHTDILEAGKAAVDAADGFFKGKKPVLNELHGQDTGKQLGQRCKII